MIINVRRQLPWRQRIISDASTAGLWAGFLWLCRPAMSVFGPARFAEAEHAMTNLVSAGAPFAAERIVLVLLGVAGVLLMWRKLADRFQPAARPERAPNYAAHFGLNDLQLHRARSSQVCVVHHDGEGRIVSIDAAALPPVVIDESAELSTAEGVREIAEAA